MKLWHIEQSEVDDYDTYDSAVVAADSPEQAADTHPNDGKSILGRTEYCRTWTRDAAKVRVRYLGEAAEGTEAGVICASFNAG